MKSLWKAVAASGLLFAAYTTPLRAATTTVVDGSCASVTSISGCLFIGNINGSTNVSADASFLNAESAYNTYNNTHAGANPDIDLNYIGESTLGADTSNGMWSVSPGFFVNFLAVKAGNNFVLYQISPATSGTWTTDGYLDSKGLSHLVFFGTQNAVPEPATWMMMLFGFGLIGGAMRRRKTIASFA